MSRFQPPTHSILRSVLLLAATGSLAAPLAFAGDFNGDRYDDMVIGDRFQDVDGVREAGVVHVVYGGPGGASTDRAQSFSEGNNGSGRSPERFAEFGVACATGDFDSDGYDDLAVSSGDSVIHVMYGSRTGLVTTRTRVITQSTFTPYPGTEPIGLGTSLAAGDFDGDGYADLLVGAPGSRVDGAWQAGMVLQFYGGSNGLSTTWCRTMHQGIGTVADAPESGDLFGWCLTVADFDLDGRDDAAIGVPGEDIRHAAKAGMVQVLFGDGLGISSRSLTFHEDVAGMEGTAEEGDLFGLSLASGRLNQDGHPDLVIGLPGQDFAGASDGGAIHVLFGTPGGPSVAGDQQLTQAHLAGAQVLASGKTIEEGDVFGFSVALADLDGDGFEDLSVGSPSEDVEIRSTFVFPWLTWPYVDAGLVHMIPSGPVGLQLDEATDFFVRDGGTGLALGTGQFFFDARQDLVTAVPLRRVDDTSDAGSALVLVSGVEGPFTAGSHSLWVHADSPNISGELAASRLFSAGALGSGNGPADPLASSFLLDLWGF